MEDSNEIRVSSRLAFWRQCFVTAAVSVNIIGHGCAYGVTALLIPSLRKPESHIRATPSEESWIASIIGFALITGNIIVTPMMDIIGRKRSHLLTILPIFIGWFLLLLVNSVNGLIIARFLQGVSMGMLGLLGSVIIGEMTDPKNRGAFLTFVSLSLTIGVLFAHSIGSFLSWQQSALVCSFTTFTSMCMIIFTPESPPWLVSKGRFEECKQMFTWLRGDDPEQKDELDKMIKAQMVARKSSVTGQKISFGTKIRRFLRNTGETFKKPEFFKPIIIMVHMYMTFQFAGMNVLNSYMTDIIKQVVGPNADANFIMVALDVERLVANILTIFLMQKIKRRTLLFSTGSVCVLSYFGKAAYVYAKAQNLLPFDNQWIPIALIGVYMFSITVVSSIPFAVSGEIFPLAYRGLGGGLSILALSFTFFVAVKCFPLLIAAIGLPLSYALYAGVVFYCLVVIYILLPETKGRTLQEIEDSFRGKTVDDKLDRAASVPLNDNDVEYSLDIRRCSSQVIIY